MIGPMLYLWMMQAQVESHEKTQPLASTASTQAFFMPRAEIAPQTLAITVVPDGDDWAVTWIGKKPNLESPTLRLSCHEWEGITRSRKLVVMLSGQAQLEIAVVCPLRNPVSP